MHLKGSERISEISVSNTSIFLECRDYFGKGMDHANSGLVLYHNTYNWVTNLAINLVRLQT
jgi:hypothetical protein